MKAKICFGKRRRKKPWALKRNVKKKFYSIHFNRIAVQIVVISITCTAYKKLKKRDKISFEVHIAICYIVIIHWNLQSILQSLKIRWSFCVLLYIVSCLCLYFFFAFAFYTHISNNFMCKCIVKRFFIGFVVFSLKCVYCTMVSFILQFIYAFNGLQV